MINSLSKEHYWHNIMYTCAEETGGGRTCHSNTAQVIFISITQYQSKLLVENMVQIYSRGGLDSVIGFSEFAAQGTW